MNVITIKQVLVGAIILMVFLYVIWLTQYRFGLPATYDDFAKNILRYKEKLNKRELWEDLEEHFMNRTLPSVHELSEIVSFLHMETTISYEDRIKTIRLCEHLLFLMPDENKLGKVSLFIPRKVKKHIHMTTKEHLSFFILLFWAVIMYIIL